MIPRVSYRELWCAQGEVYRWARCTRVLPQSQMWAVGMPLPESCLEVLEPAMAWEDLQVGVGPGSRSPVLSLLCCF